MNLTPDQRDTLNEAMVGLFRNRDDLKQFLRRKLGFQLDKRVDTGDLGQAVFDTIEIFEPEGASETDLSNLLTALRREFPNNTELKALAEFTVSAKGQIVSPDAGDVKHGLSPGGTQRGAGRDQAARKLADRGQKSAPNQGIRKEEQIRMRKQLANEMRYAVATLRKLKAELDHALADFVKTYSAAVAADVAADGTAQEALDCIVNHGLDIAVAEDDQKAIATLRILLRDVIVGIEIAEQSRRYAIVQEMSKEAADSCQGVAEKLEGEERLLLLGVVPYWRMREAYAEHQNKSLARVK